MEKETFVKIFESHRKSLKYFDHPNPTPLVITFSGVPGSGKTTIAKLLEEKYKAIRINNDQIRDIVGETLHSKDVDYIETFIVPYLEKLRPELIMSPNKIIILDSSIDRRYEAVSKFYENAGYKFFIIKLDFPREEIEQRIKNRNENFEDYLAKLDDWWQDFENFSQMRKADFVIKIGDKNEINKLLEILDSKISSNKS